MSNLLNREKKINEIEALKSEKMVQENKFSLINEIKSISKEEFIKEAVSVKIKNKNFFERLKEKINNFFNKF